MPYESTLTDLIKLFVISRSSQCSTTDVTKVVVCSILSVGGAYIKEPLLLIGKSSPCSGIGFLLSCYLSGCLP